MYNEKDKEQETNIKFAEKHGISIKIIDQTAQEVYDSLNPDDFLSDDERWGRALRRARGSYRRIANSLKNAREGMIVCRLKDSDFNRRQYNNALRVKDTEGLSAAIEQGLMDKDGNPLFQYGMDKGKPIGKPTAYGSAIGYFIDNNNGKEEYDVRLIKISDRDVESNIPICQTGRISTTPGKTSAQDFKYSSQPVVWYKANTVDADHLAPYDTDEMVTILKDWLAAFDNDAFKVPKITDLVTLNKWSRENCHRQKGDGHEYDFCFYPGRISEIAVTDKDYEDNLVWIELVDYNDFDSMSIPVYMSKNIFQSLHIADDMSGVCVLQAYSFNKENPDDIKWHLGGFLPADKGVVVEEFFGVDYGEENV